MDQGRKVMRQQRQIERERERVKVKKRKSHKNEQGLTKGGVSTSSRFGKRTSRCMLSAEASAADANLARTEQADRRSSRCLWPIEERGGREERRTVEQIEVRSRNLPLVETSFASRLNLRGEEGTCARLIGGLARGGKGGLREAGDGGRVGNGGGIVDAGGSVQGGEGRDRKFERMDI
eukprot:2523301-Pleurochrysis_carterae.AAC.2